jgi:hypothetical protein
MDEQAASAALQDLRKALEARTGLLLGVLEGSDPPKGPPNVSKKTLAEGVAGDVGVVRALARLSQEEKAALLLGAALDEKQRVFLTGLESRGLAYRPRSRARTDARNGVAS